jgi:predicted metalloprotease
MPTYTTLLVMIGAIVKDGNANDNTGKCGKDHINKYSDGLTWGYTTEKVYVCINVALCKERVKEGIS